MNTKNKMWKPAVAAGLVLAVCTFGTGAANAAQQAAAPSPASSISQVQAGSFTPALQSALAGASAETLRQAQIAVNASASVGGGSQASGGVSTQALPIAAIRVAVKAAVEVIKRTAPALWNQIRAQIGNGKTAFVKWWNNSVPRWVKDMLIGISGAAVYDALMWILGLN